MTESSSGAFWGSARVIIRSQVTVSRILIAGLGNPGRKYEGTRHNVGVEALRRLAERYRMNPSRDKFHGHIDTGAVAGEDVVLLAPQTFMNKSGRAVQAARQYYDIPASDTIVLHDDIDLSSGQLKVKKGGGHGGHNGLRDIINRTGDRDFIRIRLGIGRPEHGDVRNYVLSRFGGDEKAAIDALLEDACDAVETVLRQGVGAAQNRFH